MKLFSKAKKGKGSKQKKHAVATAPDDSPAKDTDPASEDLNDSLHNIWQSLSWYRKTTQRSLLCNVWQTLFCFVMLVVVVTVVWNKPHPVYFAVTPNLSVKALTPLDQPTMTKSGLMAWSSNVLVNTFSLDFVHWRKQLHRVRDSYTEDGFVSMFSALKDSGNLQYVIDNRLTMNTVPTGSPVLLNSGVIKGRKAWRIQIPIKIGYEASDGTPTTQRLVATMLVRRVSTLKHADGVAVEQVVLKHE